MAQIHGRGGVPLYYEESGAGLPILCLSGLTRNVRDFDPVAPHLAGCRLIRMDYRGRGRSGWADWQSYSIPQEAEDALRLLDHLGIERAAVLGTSRGGLIGLVLAHRARGRLLGLALNDIGPEIAPEGLGRIAGYLGIAPPWPTLDAAAAARPASFPGFSGASSARWREDVARSYIETERGLALRYDPKLRDAVLTGAGGPLPDLWECFAATEGLPVAVLRGDASDLLAQSCVDEMARRRPDLISAEIPGRGHVPFLDEPDAVAALHLWIQRMTETTQGERSA
ncbi:alpha/beta fold hydrolase [Poseidonocella sedimentorum]|uniref:Pimeloyl-ACP methyl ester carboxylesterase n=1 Tax=Poseidonocella sedimentorum TaxID=871652 RepID=A0A1I6E7Q3_9RHOB|nr:alpha/beta hydrolase [Poseidonocella sedimentorum]SFR13759.1 Pimeloyl-ACP methyl ester carboxylesterase [Poseidonocella sedimentorum]